MGDVGEYWRDVKGYRKEKKEQNTISSMKLIDDLGIKWTSSNGNHFIVTGKDGLIDYWPSTGKFIDRVTKKKGRGVRNLIKLCATNKEQS